MEQITFDGLKGAILMALAIAGAIYTIGKAVDTIKGWRKPKTDAQADVNKKLDTDKCRLDAHENQISDLREMSVAMCQALNALLMHEITGNSVEKLRAAKDGLDAYLITTGGK